MQPLMLRGECCVSRGLSSCFTEERDSSEKSSDRDQGVGDDDGDGGVGER